MPTITIIKNGRQIAVRPLTRLVVLGRGKDCDLCVDDERLSRQHCRIEPSPDGWLLIDLGSTNGTFAKSERINRRLLAHGDVLSAGSVALKFDLRADAAPTLDDDVLEMLNQPEPDDEPDTPSAALWSSDGEAEAVRAIAEDGVQNEAPRLSQSTAATASIVVAPTEPIQQKRKRQSLWELAERSARLPERGPSSRGRASSPASAPRAGWFDRLLAAVQPGHSKEPRARPARSIVAAAFATTAVLAAVCVYFIFANADRGPTGGHPVLRPHHSRTDD